MKLQAILALYFPLAVFSGIALWLYLARVLVPTIRSGSFSLRRHALAVALTAALCAQLYNAVVYGTARIYDPLHWVVTDPDVTIIPKLLILFSSILAVAVYNKAVFGAANLFRLNLMAVGIWLAGFIALLLWN